LKDFLEFAASFAVKPDLADSTYSCVTRRKRWYMLWYKVKHHKPDFFSLLSNERRLFPRRKELLQ